MDDLGLRLERFLQVSDGEGLLDVPLESQLGDLLSHAVTEGRPSGSGARRSSRGVPNRGMAR